LGFPRLGKKVIVTMVCVCMFTAGVVCFALSGVGVYNSKIDVIKDKYDWLVISDSNKSNKTIRLDSAGRSQGELNLCLKELKTLFPETSFAVALPGINVDYEALPPNDILLLPYIQSLNHSIIVYKPSELPPPKLCSKLVMVILDKNNAKGVNSFWHSKASKFNIPVKFI